MTSFRFYGEDGRTIQVSTDHNYYDLGCMESSLDLRPSTFEKDDDDVTGTNRLYNGKSGTIGGKFDDNTTKSTTAASNGQRDTFAVSNVIKTERKSSPIHVWCIDSLPKISKQSGSEDKGSELPDVKVGIGCDGCPNRGRQEGLQTCFGKLCRVGSLRGDVWESSTSHRTCFLVHAYPRPTQEESPSIDSQVSMSQVRVCDRQYGSPSCCDNIPILVDTFENIEDRFRIASHIGFNNILNSDPKGLIYYITCVAEFGFDHIIIIGEIEFGMIFLDCYGRVFQWDDENQTLWPLGDSLEEAQKYSVNGDEIGWIVENGIVREYISEPQCMYAKKIGMAVLYINCYFNDFVYTSFRCIP
jgi:hypothetical protein